MSQTPKYDLYHAPRTRSVRVRWLLGEMGLPCTLHDVQFASRPPGDENYGEVHPLRKVPAFQDGDISVFESLAICQYILGKNPGSPLEVTPDEPDYGRYLQWLHFGEAGMMMPVSMLLAHTTLLPEDKRDPGIVAWGRYETGKILTFLSEHAIADREFIAADRFTAADISITYMLFLLKVIREFGDAPENLKTYFKKMTSREAWVIATG
ncbi:MAG: glutathione S-transferase family protein [Maricaulis sp.]|jgi:glutathione S-transferase|nr:glutathione S-transferase family protein [Maricaulis sp.]MDG2045109.1 glutathione S-transferase family protein [Maricaulis sp.]